MHFVMRLSSRVLLSSVVVIGAGFLSACSDTGSSVRDISKFRVEQVPTVIGQPLPLIWAQMFDFALSKAHALDLDDPDSLRQIEGLVRQIPWVDPDSVEAHLAMPEGVRLYYRALVPALVIRQEGRAVGLLSLEGRALPPGFSDEVINKFVSIHIPKGTELPTPGNASSAALLQEAVRVFPEVDQLKAITKLNIVAIQQQADYRATSNSIAPPLTFVTVDGLELEWGRARDTPDPFSVDVNNRPLTLERKGQRLAQVMQQFPNLAGVGRVVLDDPLVKVFDRRGQALTLKNDIL
ncbi:MAG: hypothetical protein ACI84O_001077 [Myxococcota bacterium]|jgi:hypothetical protein